MRTLEFEPYREQRARWPDAGRHILAQFDDESVVVYQAYRPEIGEFAVTHQRFGGPWSFSRMSWIKPNFLWMMYRCGWASKPGQEVVLAVRMRRAGFDALLAAAVHSSYVPELYGDQASWKAAVKRSDVRLQWDPDHDPHGAKQTRRAIQLGLRGPTLASYAEPWALSITDISARVRAEHARVRAGQLDELSTPRERVYPVQDPDVARRLGLAPPPASAR
ncbi:MAG: DUF4291 domain-containing protein [Myxococcales bacterium]|nr:DUF4291 domain-containing protein [Myxococcales bacterium]MCB9748622.1 DUF4291 domain-containing protein [Myxococcales bacterium]